MKHLIKDGLVIQSGLPSHFTRSTGEAFWGGYENMIEYHYEDGWRDEIRPTITYPEFQSFTNPHYDPELDLVVYEVITEPVNLVKEKEIWMLKLAELRKEIAIIVMQLKLAFDPEPPVLTQLTPAIRSMYDIGKLEISELTEDNVRDYILRGPQVEELIATLNSLF